MIHALIFNKAHASLMKEIKMSTIKLIIEYFRVILSTIVCRPSNDGNNIAIFSQSVRHKQCLISSFFPDDHAYKK